MMMRLFDNGIHVISPGHDSLAGVNPTCPTSGPGAADGPAEVVAERSPHIGSWSAGIGILSPD